MAVVWTKLWGPADDGTVIRGVDLRNIQNDVNSAGLADADKIQGFPVDVPVPGDDGKALTYDDSNSKFTYTSLSGLPAGIYLPYGGATAPSGWLLCYGQAINRVTFADLFTAIGTAYGIGDGATTFNVPDMRGNLPLGKDDMGGASANRVTAAAADSLGGATGLETHTLTIAEIPAHDHPVTAYQVSGTNGTFWGHTETNTNPNSLTTGATGGGTAHTSLQPGLTGNYIIKI